MKFHFVEKLTLAVVLCLFLFAMYHVIKRVVSNWNNDGRIPMHQNSGQLNS